MRVWICTCSIRWLKIRTQRLSRAYPDLLANQFGRRFIKSFCYFHVTVAVDIAPRFLVAGKKRLRQRLQVPAFLFKTSGHLFACRAMDAFVGDTAFPIAKKEVFLGQGLEAPAFERVGSHVTDTAFHLTFV